jgi:hypothetical protein
MKRLLLQVIGLSLISCLSFCQEWSPPVRISQPSWGYKPLIIAYGDTLHVVYESGSFRDINYIRSTDGGITWNGIQVLSENYNTSRAKIVRWGDNLIAFWVDGQGGPNPNIGSRISTDCGVSWSPVRYILNECIVLYNLAASNYDSLINITFIGIVTGDHCHPYTIRSTDFGQSWSAPQALYNVIDLNFNIDQVNIENTVHFCWSVSFDSLNDCSLYYARSTDGGFSWLNNFNMNNGEEWRNNPAIAKSRDGKLAAMWIKRENESTLSLRVSNDTGSTWLPAVEMPNITAHPEIRGDIAWDDHSICVVWQDIRYGGGFGHQAIFFNRSYDGGNTWDEEANIDRDLGSSWDPSLAVTKGRAYIIWQDNPVNPAAEYGIILPNYISSAFSNS